MEVGEGRVRTMPCILRFFWTLADIGYGDEHEHTFLPEFSISTVFHAKRLSPTHMVVH